MASTTLLSVDDILASLTRQLGGNGLGLGPISTRLALHTGVSLRNARPDQMRDPVVIKKVVDALAEMGYQV